MNERIRKLYLKMIAFDGGQPGLIQHFTKVHAYCALIAAEENLSDEQKEILEAAALVHDIAIPLCMEKYGNCAGPRQEEEGLALVREMFAPLGFDEAFTERVCWLVAHHHTLAGIETMDHQILIEADYLVNAYEGKQSEEAKRNMLENVFRTETGKQILREMFSL